MDTLKSVQILQDKGAAVRELCSLLGDKEPVLKSTLAHPQAIWVRFFYNLLLSPYCLSLHLDSTYHSSFLVTLRFNYIPHTTRLFPQIPLATLLR